MTTPIRCHDCHRPLRCPPIRDHRNRPYGPDCAADRGYKPDRWGWVRPPRMPRPVRVGDSEQPSLLDQLEIEINEENGELL